MKLCFLRLFLDNSRLKIGKNSQKTSKNLRKFLEISKILSYLRKQVRLIHLHRVFFIYRLCCKIRYIMNLYILILIWNLRNCHYIEKSNFLMKLNYNLEIFKFSKLKTVNIQHFSLAPIKWTFISQSFLDFRTKVSQ